MSLSFPLVWLVTWTTPLFLLKTSLPCYIHLLLLEEPLSMTIFVVLQGTGKPCIKSMSKR